MVVGQKIALGRTHAHHELTVHVAEHTITVELDCSTVTAKPTADGQRVCQRSWYSRWKRISLSSSARHLTPTCSWGPRVPARHVAAFTLSGKARQQAGVPELHLHDLQHTGNTRAVETGANAARTDGAHGTPLDPRRFDLLHARDHRDRAIADGLDTIVGTAGIRGQQTVSSRHEGHAGGTKQRRLSA
jgi:hypothetical protein